MIAIPCTMAKSKIKTTGNQQSMQPFLDARSEQVHKDFRLKTREVIPC
jgi:hypothetical protein